MGKEGSCLVHVMIMLAIFYVFNDVTFFLDSSVIIIIIIIHMSIEFYKYSSIQLVALLSNRTLEHSLAAHSQ